MGLGEFIDGFPVASISSGQSHLIGELGGADGEGAVSFSAGLVSQGAGMQELLSDYAMSSISDRDFERERLLPNDWRLNSKEELMYYRIFKEHFGEISQLAWMGRTKGSPVQ
jgi:hypothetical protein